MPGHPALSKQSFAHRRSQAELGNENRSEARRIAVVLTLLLVCSSGQPALGCPFCRGVSETLSDRLELAEAVVIGTRSGADVTAEKGLAKGPRAQEYTVGEIFKGERLLRGATKIAAPPLAGAGGGQAAAVGCPR